MNKYARSYRNCDGACRRCGASLDRGGFKPTESGHIHIGCGGSVKVRGIPSKNPNRNLVLKSRVAEINAHASGIVVLNSSVSTEPIRTEPSPLGAG